MESSLWTKTLFVLTWMLPMAPGQHSDPEAYDCPACIIWRDGVTEEDKANLQPVDKAAFRQRLRLTGLKFVDEKGTDEQDRSLHEDHAEQKDRSELLLAGIVLLFVLLIPAFAMKEGMPSPEPLLYTFDLPEQPPRVFEQPLNLSRTEESDEEL